jgi:cellulose synthase/poly-beta-1,6-N-acetylglucosamine synthase-like glycosyltransferase
MIVVLILASLSLFSLLVALWPFGPYQATLLLARWLHRFPPLMAKPLVKAAEETFAICLCVYNERAVIQEKIEDLLRLRAAVGGSLGIHIYVDCANDGTTDILLEYTDRIDLVVSPARRGKTYGMNLLVRRANASVVMFTDANVLIAPDAVSVLRCYFADPQIGCVCSNLTYVNPDCSATALVGARYWQMNEWSKGLETDTGSVIGADGSLFAIRRTLHRPVPEDLIDDIYLSLSVLLRGYRVVRAPDLRAFEAHSTEARDEFRRKIRIACQSMHVHLTLWPELRKLDAWNLYKYLGHRLARWVGGYFMVFSAVAAIGAMCAAFGPLIGIGLPAAGVAALAALIVARFELGLKLWNVILAFAGNTIGVWRALRGQRFATWDAPESARRVALAAPAASGRLGLVARSGNQKE